jgi:hypothetical protein
MGLVVVRARHNTRLLPAGCKRVGAARGMI